MMIKALLLFTLGAGGVACPPGAAYSALAPRVVLDVTTVRAEREADSVVSRSRQRSRRGTWGVWFVWDVGRIVRSVSAERSLCSTFEQGGAR